ncbi:putative ABC transport system ATP-binding protein [Rhizobium sp. BK376]|nr:putative ABC transport system ATP-binding protein [Rhizobium sp. BK376]
MTPVAEATELYRFYHKGDEETVALRGVYLTLKRGELVGLMGPSGSGKSTLLACLAGLDDPDGGRVTICGEIMSRQAQRAQSLLRRRHIGILLQHGNLLEHLSVADNLRLQQDLAGKGDVAARHAILERLRLDHRSGSLPSQLSGGEVARAGLAVALANAPVLLICDEPTAEVDAQTEADIIQMLKEQAQNGAAVLIATHSDAVATEADRIVRLRDGRVVS